MIEELKPSVVSEEPLEVDAAVAQICGEAIVANPLALGAILAEIRRHKLTGDRHISVAVTIWPGVAPGDRNPIPPKA